MRWITVGFAVAGVICAIACGGGGGGGSSSPTTPGKIDAWVMAQQFVEGSLRSPSTANYGSVWDDYQDPNQAVTTLGAGKFRVRGWVDAQNAFGATIRNQFVCELEHVGNDRWQCSKLELDGEVVLGTPESHDEVARALEGWAASLDDTPSRTTSRAETNDEVTWALPKPAQTTTPAIRHEPALIEPDDDDGVVLSPNAKRKRDREARGQQAEESVAAAASLRLWHAATGGYTVEAIFVKVSAGQVTLRKRDGSEITLPMDRLSPADQQWIKKPHTRD